MPPLERYRNLIFAIIALAILGGIGALLTYRPPATLITIIPPQPTLTPPPSATPGPVRVYVSGAVANPATFTLPPASRVEDAIQAAGGTTEDADMTRINLAAFVRDGDQVNVPLIKDTGNGSSAPVAPTTSGPVHINTANADDLRRLPGCGPSLAQQIITYRQKNGPFKSLSDVDRVPGVGKAKMDVWKDLIVFD